MNKEEWLVEDLLNSLIKTLSPLHRITSHHTTSYYITPHNLTSHHITSHHNDYIPTHPIPYPSPLHPTLPACKSPCPLAHMYNSFSSEIMLWVWDGDVTLDDVANRRSTGEKWAEAWAVKVSIIAYAPLACSLCVCWSMSAIAIEGSRTDHCFTSADASTAEDRGSRSNCS